MRKVFKKFIILTVVFAMTAGWMYHYPPPLFKNFGGPPKIQEAQAAMSTKVGAFNTGTGAANTTVQVTGVGFQPKAVIFWWTNITGTVDAFSGGHIKQGFGVAASATSRWAVGTQSENVSVVSDTDGIHRNDAVIATLLIDGTVDGLMDLQSFDSDGFTLIIDDAFINNMRIHYLALGGADITNVTTGLFQEPGATGNQSITGLGFRPDFVLFGSAGSFSAPPWDASDLPFMIGAATGPNNEVVCVYDSENAQETMDTQSYCFGDESIALIGATTEVTDGRAAFTQFTSDGFDINWLEWASTRYVSYLAIRGGSYFVGDDLTATATGATLPITGMGFSPKAGLVFGSGKAEDTQDAVSDQNRFVMGAFTGTTERGAQGTFDEHNRANSDTERAVEHDQALFKIEQAVTGKVDVQSMDADGWTLVMDSEDNNASFFGLAGLGGMSTKVGAFNTGTGAAGTTVSVTGVGFQPKAVIFWWSNIVTATDAYAIGSMKRGFGAASSATARWAVGSQSEIDQLSSDTDSMYRNDAVIGTILTDGTVDGLMDLQSFNADGFTLVVDDAFIGNWRVHYLALGGAGLTNVTTGVLTEPNATGTQSITGLGFQPQFVLFGATHSTTTNAIVADSNVSAGMATGPLNEVACAWQSENDQATMDTQSYCFGDEVIALIGGTEVTDGRANFTQFTADGFDLNWVERASTRLVPYLALRGGSYFVSDDLTATTTGATLPVSGMGFAPAAGFLFGHGKAENAVDAVTDQDRFLMGAFTGTGERGAHGTLDEHNLGDSDTERAVEHDQALFNLQPAITGRVDVQSMDSDGWTLVMDSADTTASFFGLIGFGDSPTFNQSAYRLFNNLDSTDVGTPLAVQDSAATLGSTGAAFRLRMLLHIASARLPLSGDSFKLQFAQRGADNLCDTAFSGETYADVTTTTVIAYNDNPTPADGAALTANANDPTHGADTIINQTYEELNNFTNSVAAINVGQDGKWDFSLKDNGAPGSTAYCFRAVKSDGATLNAYTVIPQITTAAAAATISCSTNISSTSFGTLTTASIFTASPNASTTMSCSSTSAGCALYVKDAGSGSGPGLYKSAAPAYLIASADATLSAGADGYGIQATSTAAGSGGALSFNFKYNRIGNDVGGLTLTNTTLASSTVDVTNREAVVTHKAAVSSQTLSGSYTDTITYECIVN
jgi:predicted membrane protein